MEEQYIVDRSKLREVWLEHPEWSKQKLAEQVGRSKSWVKKWLKRIRSWPLEDQQVLRGQSRARKRPPPVWSESVVNRILEIRDELPVPSRSCLIYRKIKTSVKQAPLCLARHERSGKS